MGKLLLDTYTHIDIASHPHFGRYSMDSELKSKPSIVEGFLKEKKTHFLKSDKKNRKTMLTGSLRVEWQLPVSGCFLASYGSM